MLQVKTVLLPSSIHGLGVFAVDDIPQGTIVWRFDPTGDVVFPELPRLADEVRRYLSHFSFFDAGRGGHVLCGDNAKWMNHSDEANTAAVFDGAERRVYDRDVAVREIRTGEEITCNYGAFDR